MKKNTSKLNKAILLLTALYNLDAHKLKSGAVQQHTLYQTLEKIGYDWNGVKWQLKERPWMLTYRKIVKIEVPEPVADDKEAA